MKIKSTFLALLLTGASFCVFSQETERNTAILNYHRYYNDGLKVKNMEKEKSIQDYRRYFSKNAYRVHSLSDLKISWERVMDLLSEDGIFTDLKKQEQKICDQKLFLAPSLASQEEVANMIVQAYNRLWKIAEAYRNGKLSAEEALTDKYLKAIVHYGNIEVERSNTAPRFHASCFALPTAAVNTYFCFLQQMDEVEAGSNGNVLLKEACDILKTVALEAWTQPFRHDETDKNVVQINRFRNHVWWVGGNALGYRSLLPVAFMYKSIPMLDLLSEVCQKCMSSTSQNTFNTAFWTEGFTVDGAGWGHGKQCLIWGYPIDGTSNALSILSFLNGSPWAMNLSGENTETLMNYFRGGNWYYYKGHVLPCLDRYSMRYNVDRYTIRYSGMVKMLLKDWKNSFSPKEQKELEQLSQEAAKYNINMAGYPDGIYNGTRWFFNNDDLIKKNERYHIIVNMASTRCDGLESAPGGADGYNFFTDDGLTLFQKNGDEYRKIMGGWDITATPGITAREGMDKLIPVINWRGYCSKFNYAAAATNNGENAVAGFIFEKLNASEKKNVNDEGTSSNKNQIIYGVKAYKSYFMLGDYFVALGAGITNLYPEMEGSIRTTIDQTAREEEVTIIQDGNRRPVLQGIQKWGNSGNPLWVVQKNKFAYSVLPEYTRNAFFVCESKKTDWISKNHSNLNVKNLPATADILRLWIDHGQKVANGTYGYAIYAGNEDPSKEWPFSVLRNDTLVQAIMSTDRKVVEAVFYKEKILLKREKISLSTSAPCVVLMEDRGKEYTISVTDPAMNVSLKQIELAFGNKKIVVDMPKGAYCGKPATIRFSK